MLNLRYNDITGEIVKYDPKVGLTPDDEPATQEELLQWMDENPGPANQQVQMKPNIPVAKINDSERLNEVIESLTVKQTPDSTAHRFLSTQRKLKNSLYAGQKVLLISYLKRLNVPFLSANKS